MPFIDPERRRAYLRNVSPEVKAKRAVYHKAWRERNKERFAAYRKKYRGDRRPAHLTDRYGITTEQYETMLRDQHGACAICERVPDEILRVDHDHVTGRVRALLCRKCNTGIGFLGDSVPTLTKALMYLRLHDARGRDHAASE